jgi:hypothetical protein
MRALIYIWQNRFWIYGGITIIIIIIVIVIIIIIIIIIIVIRYQFHILFMC